MSVLLKWLLDLLYPPKCMLCHRLMEDTDAPTCGRCMNECDEYDEKTHKVKNFKKFTASFYYEGHVRNAIRRFKFYGMTSYCATFAQWMTGRIRSELNGMYDLISWVPCSKRRKWTRGYDQAELLAKELAKQLAVPCIQTLEKTRHTPRQSSMKNAAGRRANAIGAYKVVEPGRIKGKRILLVDDILTTGSTMSECGKMLLLAGSDELVCAAIAAVRQNSDRIR